MIGIRRGCGLAGLVLLLCADAGYAQGLPSKSYDLALSKGVHALNSGRYEEAVADFGEALAAIPNDPVATYHLGAAQRLSGRYSESLETLQTAAGLDPTLQAVHLDLGATLYHLGKYDEARDELLEAESAESAGPRLAMTQYYLGLTDQRQERFGDSAPRFLRAAALAPELEMKARYFAGIAFYRLGLFEEARDELEAVAHAARDSTLTSSARDILQKMDEDHSRKGRLSLKASLGGQYDSNVVLLPDHSALPSGISNQSDFRTVGTVQADWRWLQSPRWKATADYRFYQSLHQDLESFDVQNHDLGLNVVHTPPRPYRFEFAYHVSDAGVDHINYLRTHAAGWRMDVTGNPARLNRLEYRYENRDFRMSDAFPNNGDRTGINHRVGLSHYYFFDGRKGNLHAGYAYDRDITRGDDWDGQGYRLNLGLALPWRWAQPFLEAEATVRKYDHPHSLSTKTPREKRDDMIRLYTLTLVRSLTPWLSGSAQYLYAINASNIEAYDYDRQVVSVSMTASY